MRTGSRRGDEYRHRGLQTAIPLLTKGMAEGRHQPPDMNYFLGIDGPRRVLVADFEDTATGLNHPSGQDPIATASGITPPRPTTARPGAST